MRCWMVEMSTLISTRNNVLLYNYGILYFYIQIVEKFKYLINRDFCDLPLTTISNIQNTSGGRPAAPTTKNAVITYSIEDS